MLNKTRHKLVNRSNKELIKIDGFNKMNMVSELDDSIGNHLIAKQLSFRLQTILNERMDGYVHRADCYYSKKDQRRAFSRTIFTHNGKHFTVNIEVHKIKDSKIKISMHEKKRERGYRKHTSLLYALHKFITMTSETHP